MSFKELNELIVTRFNDLPQNFCVEYKDDDGDKIRINCEEDFLILMEDLSNAKTIKIFVTENLESSDDVTILSPIEFSKKISEVEISTDEKVIVKEVKKAQPKYFIEDLLTLEIWEPKFDAAIKDENPAEVLY
jgi:hypothetical protein